MKKLILLPFTVLILNACSNEEIVNEVQDYCGCLQKNINDTEGRYECIEMMERLLEKYKNQPRKIEVLRKETMNCN